MPGECQVARGLVHMHGNFHLSGTLLAFMVILHFFSRLLCRRSASPPRNRNRKLRSASVSPGTAVGRGGSSSMGARLSQRSSIAWAVPYHGGCDPTKRLEHAVCPPWVRSPRGSAFSVLWSPPGRGWGALGQLWWHSRACGCFLQSLCNPKHPRCCGAEVPRELPLAHMQQAALLRGRRDLSPRRFPDPAGVCVHILEES